MAPAAMDFMNINSDKDKDYLVQTDGAEWKAASQAGGVHRRMIQRLGGEVARATTVVKFDPDQSFPPHTHSGGEEFMVLDGHWHDEYGTFGKYTYIRNYIGSRHQPSVRDDGVRILVRLRQMATEHEEPEHISWDASPGSEGWEEAEPSRIFAGGDAPEEAEADQGAKRPRTAFAENVCVRRKRLHASPLETVLALQLSRVDAAGPAALTIEVPRKGLDVFVVDGAMESRLGVHSVESWAQFVGGQAVRFELREDAYLLVKHGHLASPEVGV